MRPDRDTSANTRHQQTTPGRQTLQQTPQNSQQHQAPTSAKEAEEQGTGQHNAGTPTQETTAPHKTRIKNTTQATKHHRQLDRATQHQTQAHGATMGDTATGDRNTATKRATHPGLTQQNTDRISRDQHSTGRSTAPHQTAARGTLVERSTATKHGTQGTAQSQKKQHRAPHTAKRNSTANNNTANTTKTGT